MVSSFSYNEAFDRNIGWFTATEQLTLRSKTVAIAGMGGVGGLHLLTLARLGIANFKVADLDTFEIANFNRQIGATASTLGKPKVDVLTKMVLDINPEAVVETYPEGVSSDNVDNFLSGCDLFIDGFDFFALEMRRVTFARCRHFGIPAVTAAPIGMGVAFLAFMPDSISFEEYFQFEGKNELRQYINFLLGLAPSGMHRAYLVDPTRLDIANKKTPSTMVGVELCASFTAAQAVKLLLKRGTVLPAPFHYHFDAYLSKYVARRQRGNKALFQKLKGNALEKVFKKSLGLSPDGKILSN